MNDPAITIFWHRRDLRHTDNAGLYSALKHSGKPVLPLFIFDTDILGSLEDKNDARVSFIHAGVIALNEFYRSKGSRLFCFRGSPVEIFKSLVSRYSIAGVYTNEDYEPYARSRDKHIARLLSEQGIAFKSFTDHVILKPGKIVKNDTSPYTVFTPFMKKWRSEVTTKDLREFPSAANFENFFPADENTMPTLEALGFVRSAVPVPSARISAEKLRKYAAKRDYPAARGTSRMSVHLRFGTYSIRMLARKAFNVSHTFLNELIWREFYQNILWHFPRVVNENFQRKYNGLEWRNNEDEFGRWCAGMTGYPIVDAGMHELNETGFMHNRVRMVVASFLTRHLLIDWRWGEAYFARKLLDYELASNNGGWQWAAGTGTDAQPYFRIFNPYTQAEKFDPERRYISRWDGDQGIEPVVGHAYARQRALMAYKNASE